MAKEKPPQPKLEKLFAGTPLANNFLAQTFEIPGKPVVWPEKLTLRGANRQTTTIEAYRGKTLLVSLWAEWCTPCLIEMSGIAILEKYARSDTFQLLPILTGSNRYTRPEQAADLMKKLGAENLPFLIDGRGDRLLKLSGDGPRDGTLPCNLLIDPTGRVRGRALGTSTLKDSKGDPYSVWNSNTALSFTKALAAGALA